MNESLDIETFISKLVGAQQKVINSLEDGLDERYKDQDILNYFIKVQRDSLFFNSAIAVKVADYLQLLIEEKNFNRITLQQIEQLYKIVLRIHPLDLGLYESLARYLDSVQDQPGQAKSILSSGIDRAEKKIAELKELIANIE